MPISQTYFQDAHHIEVNNAQFFSIANASGMVFNNAYRNDPVSTNLWQHVAAGAMFDSSEGYPPVDTQTIMIEKIEGWIDDPDPIRQIVWVHGPASSGKSTLAHTICERLREAYPDRFGGSFFFARGSTDRGNGLKLFVTLAYQLAVQFPSLRTEINEALYRDPSLPTKSMKIQLFSLIVQPLLRCQPFSSHRPTLVIDGLDECVDDQVEGMNTQRRIIALITDAIIEHKIPLRFIISSRPVVWIREAFETTPFPSMITLPFSLRDDNRLVLAFDVGTTYSGISYSVLEPGQEPEIKNVTRFPSHEPLYNGARKTPSIVYYDQAGQIRAIGAEALREGTFEAAEDGDWVKVEWFKLHLHSEVYGNHAMDQLPPLPPIKTVVDVFADFLRHLLECVSSYIKDAHVEGSALWDSLKDNIDFVLSHPNGWEREQAQIRKAAVLAGLIPDTVEGHARVSFVTEGEASLHFAIQNDVLSDALENGEGIIIVDAGGGTVDVSSYRNGVNPTIKSFEEIAPPQSLFHGSVFVSLHARGFLDSFLAESPFIDDLDHIVRCFDRTTKHSFRSTEEPQHIRFGSVRDNDDQCNIRFGQLKLEGTEVARFFEPSVNGIVSAVLSQNNKSPRKISYVALVGGFANSDWLFHGVFAALYSFGLTTVRPATHKFLPVTKRYQMVLFRIISLAEKGPWSPYPDSRWKVTDPSNYTPLCVLYEGQQSKNILSGLL